MSSNHPYGGPQPPMPGPGANPGPGPGQPLPPYGYPQQPSPGGPPTASGYSFGPVAPDEQAADWQGDPSMVRTEPLLARTAGPARRAAQPKGRGKILIIVGAASLAVILMAVFAVVVAMRGRANPGGSAQGQQTNPAQSSAPHSTPRPSDAVSAYLQALAAGDAVAALSYAADPAPTGALLTNEVLAESRNRAALTEIRCRLSKIKRDVGFGDLHARQLCCQRVVRRRQGGGHLEAQPCRQGPRSRLHCGRIGSGQDQRGEGGPGLGRGAARLVRLHHRAAVCRLRVQECCAGEESVRRGRHLPHPKPADQIGQEGRHLGNREELQQVPQGPFAQSEELPDEVRLEVPLHQEHHHLAADRSDPFRKPKITFDGTQARIEIPLNLKLSGSCTYQGRSGNCSGTLTGRSVAVVKVTTKPLKVDWL